MKRLLSITENLRNATDHQRVHASADAIYDDDKGELTVNLNLSDALKHPDVVRLKVAFQEANDAAREIFHAWIRRLIRDGNYFIEE